MLRVEIGALDRRPVEVAGTVAADDVLFEDLDFELGAPVQVTGRVSSVGMGRYYWRGGLVTEVNVTCRRCLGATRIEIDARVDVVFTEYQDADDPSEYVVPERTAVLELRDAVREELILAMPKYLLCRSDCRGLCVTCGTDLNVSTCDCQPPTESRWAELEALKTKSDE